MFIMLLLYKSQQRRSQDFLCGALFSPKKLTTFLVVTLKTQAKTTKLYTPAVQISPISSKIELLLCLGGCTLCLGVHLQLSSVYLAPNFFFAQGVHPLATPMEASEGTRQLHLIIKKAV